MNKLACLTAIAFLSCVTMFAQSSAPATDPSNSDHASTQNGASDTTSESSSHTTKGAKRRTHTQTEDSQAAVPDTTVNDQQSSTTSTTGVSGQTDRRSHSRMGTTGKTPATTDQSPSGNHSATPPPDGASPDQQPNSSTDPGSMPPRAAMNVTPAARAMATHTPDPGTCMNAAAFDNAPGPGGATAIASDAARPTSADCH